MWSFQGVGGQLNLFVSNYANVFTVAPSTATGSVVASLVVVNGSLLDYNFGLQVYSFTVTMITCACKKRLIFTPQKKTCQRDIDAEINLREATNYCHTTTNTSPYELLP